LLHESTKVGTLLLTKAITYSKSKKQLSPKYCPKGISYMTLTSIQGSEE
jgi:hypothetical protein